MTRVRFPPPAPRSKAIDSDYAVSGGAAGRNGGSSCDQRGTVRRSVQAHTLSVAFLVGSVRKRGGQLGRKTGNILGRFEQDGQYEKGLPEVSRGRARVLSTTNTAKEHHGFQRVRIWGSAE